jgi:hypothetical protein
MPGIPPTGSRSKRIASSRPAWATYRKISLKNQTIILFFLSLD